MLRVALFKKKNNNKIIGKTHYAEEGGRSAEAPPRNDFPAPRNGLRLRVMGDSLCVMPSMLRVMPL